MTRGFIGFGIMLVLTFGACFTPAQAYSFHGADLYVPTLTPMNLHFLKDGKTPEPIPQPEVKITSLVRGVAEPGVGGNDAGRLSISITMPSTSTYDIGQFGVYFRVIEGTADDLIFPDVPVVGERHGREMSLTFLWLDPPMQQNHLKLKVEAFFVGNGLEIGPSRLFEVND